MEADVVTVSVDLMSNGQIFESTNRGTFSDGTCTYRFTSSATSAGGSAEITVDGVSVAGEGSYTTEEFRFTTRC
jgi:hypothetical protein